MKYEPKAQPKDLRTFKRLSARTGSELPEYNMIPEKEVVVDILRHINYLNGAIKFPNCPVRKNTFYSMKTRMIAWFISICKKGVCPGFRYVVNSVEKSADWDSNPHHCTVAIELWIDSMVFKFHTPIENFMLRTIFDEVYLAEIQEFKADEHAPAPVAHSIECWEELHKLLEDNNWFIYEQSEPHSWIDAVSHTYPHLKLRIRPSDNIKLATMLAGGPMIQLNGSDLCKLNHLRTNFSKVLENAGHKYDFSLNFRKL